MATSLKHPISSLPGELLYREKHAQIQAEWRSYQDWRIADIGLQMSDIDCLETSRGMEDRFDAMRVLEYGPASQTLTGRDGTEALENHALFEMKFWRVKQAEVERLCSKPSPVRMLADMASLPFFVIRYFPPDPKENRTHWEFTSYPANDRARKYQPNPVHMSERRYVWFLHLLRGQRLDMGDPKLARFNDAKQKSLAGEQLWTPERFYR